MNENNNSLKLMSSLRPVLLTHFQSSGLIYLHSLFDGHRQILTIPGIPNLSALFSTVFKSTDEALSIFNKANPKFYNTFRMTMADYNNAGLFRLGNDENEGIVTPKDVFENHFKQFMQNNTVTIKNVILGLYYAYAVTHNQNLDEKRIILYHPHINRNAIALYKVFSNAKFIVTIRNPERAYVSRYNLMKNKAKVRNKMFSHFGLLGDLSTNVEPLVTRNVQMRIVRVEDFASNAKSILTELCKFINIQYDSTLETSSFGGKKYWGANPKYRSNKFDNKRHSLELGLARKERRIFSLIGLRFNKVTGYRGIDLTYMEKKLAFVYLLAPTRWGVEWFRENFIYAFFSKHKNKNVIIPGIITRIKELLKLLYEKGKTVYVYYRDSKADKQYKVLKENLIEP